MPRITPKTNWVANDIPIAQDINRIETNSLQAFTELDQEVVNRNAAILVETVNRQNADTTLQNNINSEAATRLANDNTLQGNIDTANSLRSSGDATLQTNIDTANSLRLSGDNSLDGSKLNNANLLGRVYDSNLILAGGTYTIPAGTYARNAQSNIIEILGSDGTWRTCCSAGVAYPVLISDGTNMRINNNTASVTSRGLTKIAP